MVVRSRVNAQDLAVIEPPCIVVYCGGFGPCVWVVAGGLKCLYVCVLCMYYVYV